MSQLLNQIVELITRGEVRISAHGYDELAEDGILVREALDGIHDAVVIEDYTNYSKGPCVLVLEYDFQDKPIHVVWDIPRNKTSPAVLVTAYRPLPEQWSSDFLRRKS